MAAVILGRARRSETVVRRIRDDIRLRVARLVETRAVQIHTPMHPLDAAQRRLAEFGKPVDIGSDLWIGGGAIILPGVRIRSRTVIGAGSIVTRGVPDQVVAAGSPSTLFERSREEAEF